MGPRRVAVTQCNSVARMLGQDPKSPRHAASPSERAANPEDENSRLTELVMNLEEKVSSLETDITVLNSKLEECRQVVQEMASAFGGGGIADMRREMEQMSIQIGLLQRAVSNIPAVAPDAGARLRIPEPKAYGGARDAKEVENYFLFDDCICGVRPIPGVIKKLLTEFEDVMPDELPRKLPPKRAVDHEIELVPGTKLPPGPYRMSQPELVELRKQLKEMLESGIIKPTKSPYGAPVLFQKKADGSLHLRSGYWQVRIKEGDEAKTTVVTRYGASEFLVMPFGLTNAPATFSIMMNQVLHGFLDEFVVWYLDDIVVYSGTLAEHVEHLRQVLTRLREHELYAKVSKCLFAQETISFLGHIMERGRIRMDPKKVQAIEEWRPPIDVHDLRSFLGLANYYRRFVKGYSEIAQPMTDLLKKTETWD
ncbi:UNVERIFIED_CONTAM: Retrovirus-related Pol polyprotein from transposon [Sesamum radiatum]|uniref:Retrovirus-related Pol polyprotein from transposon n=1 Tax=Sesamum radiatum TaxID=300843 RepID=A0AAW2K7W5_SESRA